MASTLALKPRLNWWEVSALCHPCNRFNISIRQTVFLFLSSFYSYVFWLGDFNYRINETIENIKGLCGKQEYSALWPHDQVFESILYIYIVMYSVPLLYCGSSTVSLIITQEWHRELFQDLSLSSLSFFLSKTAKRMKPAQKIYEECHTHDNLI